MTRIERIKRVHAIGMLVLPALGTMAAIARAATRGVSLLEVTLFAVMYSAAMIGITVGYHRHFAHGAFKTPRWTSALLLICGSMAGQGPAVYWVSNHRMHHHLVDAPGDPHSPHFDGERELRGFAGFFHAHVGWTWRHPIPNTVQYAKDLLKDTHVRGWSERYLISFALGFAVPTVVGAIAGGADGAVGGLLWGGFVRAFVGYQVALSIGSFAHTFGARPFEIRGQSGNSFWLAVPTFGEGWHQNHHAFPTAASFGQRWSQLDIGAMFIRVLAALGLAWDVREPAPDVGRRKRSAPTSAPEAKNVERTS